MEIQYIINLVLIIAVVHLLLKNRKNKETLSMFDNCRVNGKVINPNNDSYDHKNKESTVNHVLDIIARRRKFFGDDFSSITDKQDRDELNAVKKAFDDPRSKELHIFHGGCLGCRLPEELGIGKCAGCKYFTADWSLPNLHLK